MKRFKIILTALLLMPFSTVFSQTWHTEEANQKAVDIVKNMTLNEKFNYVGGVNWMYTKPLTRLGVPQLKMSDGPQGLGTHGLSTAYPSGILLSATWNEDMANAYGKALGRDCRARGVNIFLGPAVNIYRAPMCGRNFEYMGEDPFLTSRMDVEYIKGVQAQGVMATVKHFCANFQEYDRNNVSSDIDERTLNEIYFPAFKAAVKEGGAALVMTSYNLLNGQWTTENKWLLTDVLRKKWGFNGIIVSDWGSTHHGLLAANAGLDLEMASNEKMTPDSLRYYLNSSKMSIETLNAKCQHILQTLVGFNFLTQKQEDLSIPLDDSSSVQTALNVAREGIVLLKNKDGILPFNLEKVKKIAVVGPNATMYLAGGGSGLVFPFHFTTIYDGMKKIGNEHGFEVTHIDEYDHMSDIVYTVPLSTSKGFVGEYFPNIGLTGTPVAVRTDSRIGFDYSTGTHLTSMPTSKFSVRWTGELRPTESGTYDFRIGGDDGFRLYINDALVVNAWKGQSYTTLKYTKTIEAGKTYKLKIEYFQDGGGGAIDFAWNKQGSPDYFLEQLKNYDAVVACYGHKSGTEGEASDRSFELPTLDANLIKHVQQSLKPVIGVVSGGGNIEMQSWEPGLGALLWTFYAGQEGGTAVAEILFGIVNPSGKLPVTFEKKWSDNPTFNSYYDADGDKHVKFTEGIFMGYRGYDKLNREVQYPFGHGLSYTTFSISNMNVNQLAEDTSVVVNYTLTNTGDRDGAQVVQLYVGKRSASSVARPLKELKSFKKVFLKAGESTKITVKLKEDVFQYYSVAAKTFVLDPGKYEIMLGFSSRDIQDSKEVTLSPNLSTNPVQKEVSTCLVSSFVKQGEKIAIQGGKASSILIYTANGILVSNQKDSNEIDTKELSSGYYLVSITIDSETMKEVFVVG